MNYFLCSQNERRLLSFYLPKVLIVGLLWLSAVTMASWQKCNELKDPTYNYKIDTSNFYVRFFITLSYLSIVLG